MVETLADGGQVGHGRERGRTGDPGPSCARRFGTRNLGRVLRRSTLYRRLGVFGTLADDGLVAEYAYTAHVMWFG